MGQGNGGGNSGNISKRLRYEIFRRDNHACRYCGATAPLAKLSVDHVVPTALGGTDEPSNLVTACMDCNAGKSSSAPDQPIVEDVSADAVRWGRALQLAADVMLTAHDERQAMLDEFLCRWNEWTFRDWKTGEPRTVELPSGWQQSVTNLLRAGLPMPILHDCIDTAMGSRGVTDEFRYMCGVAWNKVRQLQQIATEVIEADSGLPPRPQLDDPMPLTDCFAETPPVVS